MAICKDLGMDVKEVEDDLRMFQSFLERNLVQSSHRRYFDRYYKPLMMNVGEALYQEPDAKSTAALKACITSKEKHQRSTTAMWSKALRTAKAHPQFIELVKQFNQSPDDLWKQAKAFIKTERVKRYTRYTCMLTGRGVSSKKVLYKAYVKLQGLDIDPTTVELQDALNYISTGHNTLSGARIVVLRTLGGVHLDQAILQTSQECDQRLERWQTFNTRMDIDFHGDTYQGVFDGLLEALPCARIDQLGTLSVSELVQVLGRCQAGRNCYRVVEYFLRDQPSKLDELKDQLHSIYTGIKIEERFCTTSWRTTLYEHIRKRHSTRLNNTSANPAVILKEVTQMRLNHLLYMEEYAQNKYGERIPEGMDALKWLFGALTLDMAIEIITAYGLAYEPKNELVKSTRSPHHAKYVVGHFMRLLRDDVREYILCSDQIGSLTCKALLDNIPNKRVQFDGRQRRMYTPEEMDRMIEVSKMYPQYPLMITIFREIGLRVGCMARLMYYDLVDQFHHPRHQCQVVEKKRKARQFTTGPNLKRMLVSYIKYIRDTFPDMKLTNFYLFNLQEPYQPLTTESIRYRLKRIGELANVGVAVHPHVFRHTIVGTLIDAGNSMDLVSKFIGHETTDVTYRHYWLKNPDDMNADLANPYSMAHYSHEERKQELEDDLDLAHAKIDHLLNIVGVFQTVVRDQCDCKGSAVDVRTEVMDRLPNLQQILYTVARSINGDTSSCVSSTVSSFTTLREHT